MGKLIKGYGQDVVYTQTPFTLNDGDTSAFQGDANGALKVAVVSGGGGGGSTSTGSTGAAAPTSATEIGGVDPSGNLQPAQVSAYKELITARKDYGSSGTITAADTGSTTTTGQQNQSIITGAASANSTVTTAGLTGNSSFSVLVTGTFVGTLQFERSLDGGTTWTPVSAFAAGTPYSIATITNKGAFHGNASAATNLRVRATAWTSGSATINFIVGAGTGTVTVGNPIRLFDKTNGNEAGIDANGRLSTNIVGGYALEVNQQVSSGTTVFTQDTTNYRWVSVQLLAPVAWSGVTVTFEASNDNTNWVGTFLANLGSQSNGPVSSTTITGIYEGPINAKYFRVRVSGYGSGTIQAIAEFAYLPSFLHTFGVNAQQSGGWDVRNIPNTSNGLTMFRLLSAASTNATVIKSSLGQIYNWKIHNTTASAKYVKIYNKATAPTVGTDTPVKTIMIPANSTDNYDTSIGIAFNAGIGIAITGALADSDTTAVAANDVIINLDYK